MKLGISAAAVAVLSVLIFSPAAATPGRTDKNGCHTDKTGGTGYHCHNGSGAAAPAPKPASNPPARKETKAPASTRDSRPSSRSSGGSVYYQNCAAARAAGAAPIRQGEPGYAPKLDRDKDGIACE